MHPSFELLRSLNETAPQRFIVWGSLGRSAVSGQPVCWDSVNRFRDVDVIDLSGGLSEKYTLGNGSVLGVNSTKLIHSVSPNNTMWGIYDILTPASPDEPIITFDAQCLGIGSYDLVGPKDDECVTLQTIDSSAHLSLIAICRIAYGPFSKHTRQIEALRVHEADRGLTSAQAELRECSYEYVAKVKERLKIYPLPNYVRFRRQMFAHFPRLSQAITDNTAGELLRNMRGSQPVLNSAESLAALVYNEQTSKPDPRTLLESSTNASIEQVS